MVLTLEINYMILIDWLFNCQAWMQGFFFCWETRMLSLSYVAFNFAHSFILYPSDYSVCWYANTQNRSNVHCWPNTRISQVNKLKISLKSKLNKTHKEKFLVYIILAIFKYIFFELLIAWVWVWLIGLKILPIQLIKLKKKKKKGNKKDNSRDHV